MLSNDMKVKLAQRVEAWALEANASQTIASHVLNIASSDPQSEHDVRSYCEQNMLSTALVEWYNKFVDYLANSENSPAEDPKPTLPDDVLETARRFRDALNLFLEKYDVQ